MKAKRPPWLRSAPPADINCISAEECAALERLFWSRATVVPTTKLWPDQSRMDLVRPSANYTTCGLPDGILCFIDDQPELAHRFETQINLFAPTGITVWPLGNCEFGAFQGQLTTPFRRWLHSDLVVSPLALISPDAEVVCVFDEQMRYGLAGVGVAMSDAFFGPLGGIDRLGTIMSQYIDDFGVGFGEADRQWARLHLSR